MIENDVLLILILRDVGMRSTLAARLSVAGAQVITAPGLHDPAITRGIRQRAVLVLEEEAVANRSAEWLEALVEDTHWLQVVLLVADPDAWPEHPAGRMVSVARAQAYPELAARLPGWSA